MGALRAGKAQWGRETVVEHTTLFQGFLLARSELRVAELLNQDSLNKMPIGATLPKCAASQQLLVNGRGTDPQGWS